MNDNKFSYFVFGVGVGAAIGLLFAPKAGQETRGYLRDRAGEGREYLKRGAEQVRHGADQVRHGAEQVRERAGRVMERASDTARATRDKLYASAEPRPGDEPYGDGM